MTRFTSVLIFILSLQVHADDFRALELKPEKIECSIKNQVIQFKGAKVGYPIYDNNSRTVKLQSCEKIKIKNFEFYTAQFTNEIHEGTTSQKVLTYEVALLTKSGTLQTVRSEIVDQIELSGDLLNTNFDSSIHVTWGQSKKDERILLKVEIRTKNEKPLNYLLKLNSKLSWFENLFEKK